MIKNVKNTVPWPYVMEQLNGEETVGTFYEKELQNTNQTGFRIENVMNKNDDKLYLQWKNYDNFLNSWINKKR